VVTNIEIEPLTKAAFHRMLNRHKHHGQRGMVLCRQRRRDCITDQRFIEQMDLLKPVDQTCDLSDVEEYERQLMQQLMEDMFNDFYPDDWDLDAVCVHDPIVSIHAV
jgi:hypothetical protein